MLIFMILILYILKLWMTSNTSNNILRSIIDKEKLSETNFLDWHRNLRIVLKHEKKLYVHDEVVHEEAPPFGASKANRDAYCKHANHYKKNCILRLLKLLIATIRRVANVHLRLFPNSRGCWGHNCLLRPFIEQPHKLPQKVLRQFQQSQMNSFHMVLKGLATPHQQSQMFSFF